ncbi:MAG: motility protein A [Thermoguttaceae bacterium]|jgi:chemotaxis protein MotA
MDVTTIGGLILGFLMMGCALAFMGMSSEGGINLAGFIDPPAIMMVLGGGTAVMLVGFPLHRVLSMFPVMKKLFFRKKENLSELIQGVVKLAEVARREGLLALENKTKDIKDSFVALGIQMAVDGIKPEIVEEIMRTEIESMETRHNEGRKVLETIGRCGPAFGMIATLLGLVMMLGNLSNAASIGPSMAVALIGTLYGAVTANLICIPMAEKLACLNHEEVLIKEIVLRGVLSIQAGDSPRVVEQKLITFLPPKMRPFREATA